MKRPIAMLLALLLTAGLFAFVSCGEKKNYTVKEIEIQYNAELTRVEKHIFFDDKTISEIIEGLEKNKQHTVQLKGFSDEDIDYIIPLDTTHNLNYSLDDSYLFQHVKFAARCQLMKKEIYVSFYYNNVGDVRIRVFPIWTAKIKKMFYTDEHEQETEVIKIASDKWIMGDFSGSFDLQTTQTHLQNFGIRLREYGYMPIAPSGRDFYIMAKHSAHFQISYGGAIAKFTSLQPVSEHSIIDEIEPNKYLYNSIIYEGLSDEAQVVENVVNLSEQRDMILETDNMDELFSEFVNRIKNQEVEE